MLWSRLLDVSYQQIPTHGQVLRDGNLHNLAPGEVHDKALEAPFHSSFSSGLVSSSEVPFASTAASSCIRFTLSTWFSPDSSINEM